MNSWDRPWEEKIRALQESSSVDMAISRLIQLADELYVRTEQQERLLKEQADLIKDLARTSIRQSENIAAVNKRVDKLSGVHGA